MLAGMVWAQVHGDGAPPLPQLRLLADLYAKDEHMQRPCAQRAPCPLLRTVGPQVEALVASFLKHREAIALGRTSVAGLRMSRRRAGRCHVDLAHNRVLARERERRRAHSKAAVQ